MKITLPIVTGALSLSPFISSASTLLLSELMVTPTSDEFIEIYNPTGSPINLENYYLSDDEDYALLPGASGSGPAPTIGSSDFIAQFPTGISIAPGQVMVIAFDGARFTTTFGFSADFEIHGTDAGTVDLLGTDVGASAGLTNSGENVSLFYWDGLTDLVLDVDMMNVGTPSSTNDIGNKTGIAIDGPDADILTSSYLPDAGTMPQQSSDPGFGFSTKRILLENGHQIASGGNGILGADETSEDISTTCLGFQLHRTQPRRSVDHPRTIYTRLDSHLGSRRTGPTSSTLTQRVISLQEPSILSMCLI